MFSVILTEFWDGCSDDSVIESDEEEIALYSTNLVKIPRISIIRYFEEVVPAYADHEFVTHFRVTRIVYRQLIRYFKATWIEASFGICPRKSVAIFLWYAGHSVSFREVSDRFDISISTVNAVLIRCIACFSVLTSEYIKWPTEVEQQQTIAFYKKLSNFPGVVGSAFRFY